MPRARALAPLALLPAAVLAAGPAAAHHGWGGYDSGQLLTLTGTVRQAAAQNPHAMLNLEADGKVWHVVLAPPGRMSTRGLPADTIKVGQSVTVVGYPAKADPAEMRAERITAGDRTIELR
ncbi:DUF6152 family protein [Azospirillum rugosum]|uniref:DUF5666 domain-containing protein n=1 Tax=Azospirillum rugosum TaxID=416170 RepID=A0ABS4SE62_9PROT|nr:DUF6152 family protein [Azospirillum rugosum]MBP2290861.1 hypothetical protein [Azospirillum rugosum]MDQ0529728.1 hypothetical protein [Azospirillum rugosum]